MNAQTDTIISGATVARGDLLAALRLAALVTDRRNTIPILLHALISAEPGVLTIRATCLDREFRQTIHAEGAATFQATAPVHELFRLVRGCEGETIQLAREGEVLILRSGATVARFWTMPTEDFPASISLSDDASRFSMSAQILASLLDRCRHSISMEETRYYLNGVFFQIDGEGAARELVAVATDGHRLARCGAAAPDGCAMPQSGVILPRLALPPLLAMLARDPEGVTVEAEATRVRFRCRAGTLTAKAIYGQFPAWQRVIPETAAAPRATIKRGAFAGALRRLAAPVRDRSFPATITGKPDALAISTSRRDEWGVSEDVPCTWAADRPMGWDGLLGANVRYLADTLAQIGGDVVMENPGAGSPLVFRDTADPRALFILMPMRV